MLSDFRFAFRTLARNRGFTAVTVLTLALGIGSAASIFSVTDWILFRMTRFPTDVYLVGGLLLLTSVLACVLPARRATRVDISKLLRSE